MTQLGKVLIVLAEDLGSVPSPAPLTDSGPMVYHAPFWPPQAPHTHDT